MSVLDKVKLACTNPREIGRSFMAHTAQLWKSDETYLKLMYYFKMGKRLNLKNPVTYNEKLQWLKLHDRNPKYTLMVDKLAVKDYVASLIGKEYIIPTLAVWDTVDEIDLSGLPDKFVLKTTNGGGGGGVVICRDKASFDLVAAKKKLSRALSSDIFIQTREWPYKNVVGRIIAEEYISDGSSEVLKDYKFYCFNGIPKVMLVATERFKSEHPCFDYFDMEKNHLPFTQGGENNSVQPSLPENFDEMVKSAAALSVSLKHVRVDLYDANEKIYFGELTFFDSSGYAPFYPEEWDRIFGNWIEL